MRLKFRSIRPARPAAEFPAGGEALLRFWELATPEPAVAPVSSPGSPASLLLARWGGRPAVVRVSRPAPIPTDPAVDLAPTPGRKLFSQSTFQPGPPEGDPDPDAGEFGDELEEEISGPETGLDPQPSDPDGVPEDMATLVLDKSTLGVSQGTWPESLTGDLRNDLRADIDPASDAAVMLRVAAGDEAGFNFLVGKYHRPMINFLYRMVHNQAVAEELAQEVFLRVYRARASYRAEARFTTWLYRIATNLAVNHARDTRHERAAQTVYLDAPDEETGTTPDVADGDLTAEERMLRDERMAAIRAHVLELPERQRTAVLMHKYQGMDYRQIGEVLKLSESATKSLLFRAYQTLRAKLKDFV
jgi:RNA polymerase sigma-70 factor, ECF subfamily